MLPSPGASQNGDKGVSKRYVTPELCAGPESVKLFREWSPKTFSLRLKGENSTVQGYTLYIVIYVCIYKQNKNTTQYVFSEWSK